MYIYIYIYIYMYMLCEKIKPYIKNRKYKRMYNV